MSLVDRADALSGLDGATQAAYFRIAAKRGVDLNAISGIEVTSVNPAEKPAEPMKAQGSLKNNFKPRRKR